MSLLHQEKGTKLLNRFLKKEPTLQEGDIKKQLDWDLSLEIPS